MLINNKAILLVITSTWKMIHYAGASKFLKVISYEMEAIRSIFYSYQTLGIYTFDRSDHLTLTGDERRLCVSQVNALQIARTPWFFILSRLHCAQGTLTLKHMWIQLPGLVRGAGKGHSCVRGMMGTCQMTQAYAPAAPTIWKFIFRSQNNFAWLCPQSQNWLFSTIECISQIEFCKGGS